MYVSIFFFFFFFFKQKTAYEIMPSLVGSEMCIRDRGRAAHTRERHRECLPRRPNGRRGVESSGLVQPPLDALAYHIPGPTGAGVTGELGEPAVEFGRLGRGERQFAGVGGHAVPEILGELDALSDGELADVEVGGAHVVSLPRVLGRCNTVPVDTCISPSVPLTHRA